MDRQRALALFLCILFLAGGANSQGKKALEERERLRLSKETTILDRALGIHNRSNIGEAFENRGKLYPVRSYFDQGIVSGEFPIGSRREYVYRMNPYVGIPGNVIQGRWRENQEFEAVAGYHNRDSARVAVSTKPYTWPSTGWPVKDANGEPVFVSDQDSYCVYSDSANTRGMLGIEVHQTGYAFSYTGARNMVVFIYDVVNKSSNTYGGLYFGMYSDIDVGNALGVGADEYNDDRVSFDQNLQLLYFYDDGYTPDWPGNRTGFFGITFLQTPTVNGSQPGMTDWHYFVYDDDIDHDELEYGIMSSSDSLYRSRDGSRYFHLGPNPTSLHYDNPSTIPASGLDLVAMPSSGPYTIHPNEVLTFVTAMVAGNTEEEIKKVTAQAHLLLANNWRTPKPPVAPKVTVVPGDRRATITWDNRSEFSRDPYTGEFDFEGYRLYRSTDRGQHWDQFNRNETSDIGPDPVPLADFDKINRLGKDRGLAYIYTDTNLVNGFEYWYCVTAYDRGDSSSAQLESPRANTLDEDDVGRAIPSSEALGRVPVGVSAVSHTGASDAVLTVSSEDVARAAGKNYEISFAPVGEVVSGNLRTLISVTVDTITSRTNHTFGMTFLSPTTFRVTDLSVARIQIRNGTYTSGIPISFNAGATIVGLRVGLTDTASAADQRPEAGDSLVFRMGTRMRADGVETLPLQGWSYGTTYADANGVIFRLDPVPPVAGIQQVTGTNPLDVRLEVLDTTLFVTMKYILTVTDVVADPADPTGTNALASFLLADSTGKRVSSADSLPSGGPIDGPSSGSAWTLTVFFKSGAMRPTVGTAVEIRTVRQTPLNYAERYTFATTGATTDQPVVASGLDRIRVVPNPYIVSTLYEEEFGQTRREPIRQLKFNHLPSKCSITIFTLDGDRLITLDHDSDNGTLTWDLRTSGGREIASGVYIYLVKTDIGEHLGRFAVIK
jgi:hypothetical protein